MGLQLFLTPPLDCRVFTVNSKLKLLSMHTIWAHEELCKMLLVKLAIASISSGKPDLISLTPHIHKEIEMKIHLLQIHQSTTLCGLTDSGISDSGNSPDSDKYP